MKFRLFALFLIAALLFTGCAASALEYGLDTAEDAVEKVLSPGPSSAVDQPPAAQPGTNAPVLTKEQAQAIALEHAGFTADQVRYLRVEYEIDDGIPQYEVQFHQDRWEYDYEINAETGAILSYDRDD